jgi:hypothetical protein
MTLFKSIHLGRMLSNAELERFEAEAERGTPNNTLVAG